MPVDLLSYHGDAGLGLGSNPDINVPVADNRVINDTMRNIMLLDNEKNMKLWQQKVKDRDQLEALILNNQISTGEIDPKDQKYFDNQKAAVEKAYDAWGGNFNDTSGFRKYQAAVTGLQDTATHAQTRWAGLKKLQQERSQQTLPSKIKAYDNWIDQESKKPFGSQIVPYQQLHDFSIDDINSGVTPIKTSIIDPNNPISYDVSTVDYQDILKNKRNDYLNDMDKADSMDQFTDKLMKYNQPQLQKTLATMDAKIAQYNQDRGFKEGDQGFVSPVKVHKNDDGSVIIAEPKTDLAAKWALANQEQFITKTPKFNKDILKGQYDRARLGLEADRNKILAAKVGVEQQKATAYVKHLNAATKKITDQAQAEGTDIFKEYNSFIDNLKPQGITLKSTDTGQPTGKQFDAIFMDQMPAGFQYINGPVVDSKGKVSAGKLIPFRTSDVKDEKTKENIGRPYYIPEYVYPATGERLDLGKMPSEMQEGYDAAKKATGMSKADYVKILLKKGILELQLKGKNGTANYTSLAQSAKLINNQTAKKGQENVMNTEDVNPNAIDQTEQELSTPPENPENN
jgi:hypothetical protein